MISLASSEDVVSQWVKKRILVWECMGWPTRIGLRNMYLSTQTCRHSMTLTRFGAFEDCFISMRLGFLLRVSPEATGPLSEDTILAEDQ